MRVFGFLVLAVLLIAAALLAAAAHNSSWIGDLGRLVLPAVLLGC